MAGLLNLLRSHQGLLALLGFTLVIRGGLMIARFDQLRDDPDSFNLIAHNIVRIRLVQHG